MEKDVQTKVLVQTEIFAARKKGEKSRGPMCACVCVCV